MAVTLNSAGENHARSLIDAGNYDNMSPWSFSAEDGDKLLGPGGNDWSNFGKFHLGEDSSAAEQTKARYKYPFGKDGKVYGGALRAIRSRASQQDETAIYDAAGRLMDRMKEEMGMGDAGDSEGGENALRRARLVNGAPGYRMLNRGSDAGEIYLYGQIGASWFGDGITADQFQKDLKALGPVKTIDLRINSEGGDVFDGKAMYTLLQQHSARIVAHVDGLAASAASYIAMAAAEIRIAQGAFMMIHDAWGIGMGNAADLRRTAELLDTVSGTIADVYAARTKQPLDAIRQWMADETWLTAADAMQRGFADHLVENVKAAASVRDPSRFKRLPAALRPNRANAAAALRRIEAALAA